MEVENFESDTRRVKFAREFPPGCVNGTMLNTATSFKGSFAVKFHGFKRDFPPGCGPNAMKITQIGSEKGLKSEKISGSFSDSTDWRRSVSAMKSKPIIGGKFVMKKPQKVKFIENVVVSGEMQMKGKEPMGLGQREVKGKEPMGLGHSEVKGKENIGGSKDREKVLEMLGLFRKRCDELLESGKVRRVDVKADADLKLERKIIHQPALMVGHVPGVEIGDKFYYRIELVIVGLHRKFQGGIDYMDSSKGKIATCIVANERHLDKMNDPNVLTYVGEGGTRARNEVGVPPDQKLEAGNYALWNSMKEKKVVRVVRGLNYGGSGSQKIVYVYDGLYEVKDCDKKKGPEGNMIFEFRLTRCPGQPLIPWETCRLARF